MPNNAELFDHSLYMRAPVFSLATGISLARALLATVPTGMPAIVKKAAAQLAEHTDASESLWVQRQRVDLAASEVNTRAIDTTTDRAWMALRGRLDSCALLAVEDQPLAPRAAELVTILFGDGMTFLKATYAEQSATTSALLRRVDEDRLGKELDAICGPEYLRAVRRLQPQYEAMVASVLQREESGLDFNVQLRALGRAIVNYTIKVASTVADDDQKTIDRARTALRPLDNFRASNPQPARAPNLPTDPPDPEPESAK